MTDDEVLAFAQRAVSAWGGAITPIRMIKNRENAVFEVMLKDGGHAALRLHRMGYQTAPSIEAELLWMEALADAAFPCPRPLRTGGGFLLFRPESGPIATAVSWIEARPIGENGVRFNGTVAEHCALYEHVGRLIRSLHNTTRAMGWTQTARPAWDANAFVGETPLWGRYWENPSLSDDETGLLQLARRLAAKTLSEMHEPEHLIHADLLQENILRNGSGLWIIDFDDSGLGFPGYDLGSALIQHAELDYLDALSDALLSGYNADAHMVQNLPLFILLRSLASCGWIISRAPANDPRQRFYAERALLCARRFIQTTTSISS